MLLKGLRPSAPLSSCFAIAFIENQLRIFFSFSELINHLPLPNDRRACSVIVSSLSSVVRLLAILTLGDSLRSLNTRRDPNNIILREITSRRISLPLWKISSLSPSAPHQTAVRSYHLPVSTRKSLGF